MAEIQSGSYEIGGKQYTVTNNGPSYRTYDSNKYYIGDSFTVNGITYYAYLPEGANEVDGTLYWTGSSGYQGNYHEYAQISGYYSDGNKGYVFISNDIAKEFNSNYYNSLNALVKYLHDEKGISVNFTKSLGYSAGGDDCFEFGLRYLNDSYQNGNTPSQMTFISFDPADTTYRVTQTDINSLQNNNSQVVIFTIPYNRKFYINNSSAKGKFITENFTKNNIDALVISGNFDHPAATKRAYEDGWLDYFDGNIGLEEITNTVDYKIDIPVSENGNVTWKSYDLATLQDAIVHPENYDNIDELNNAISYIDNNTIKISEDFISVVPDFLNKVENLRDNMKKDINFAPFESSSLLLQKRQEALLTINETLYNFWAAFASEINNMIYAGKEYCRLDSQLQENTNILNKIMSGEYTKSELVESDKSEESNQVNNPSARFFKSPYSYGGNSSSSNEEKPLEEDESNTTEDINTNENNNENIEEIDNSEKDTNNNENESTNDNIIDEMVRNNSNVKVTHVNITENTTNNPKNNYKPSSNIGRGGAKYTNKESVSQTITIEPQSEMLEPENSSKIGRVIYDDTINFVIDKQDNDVGTPIIDNDIESESTNNKKSGSALGALGAIAGVAGVTAAGVYGAKKYMDNKKENESYEEDAYGSEEIPSLEEQYGSYNRPKTFENVDFYKSSKNSEGEE